MYAVTSIPARNPVQLLQTSNDNVTAIKKTTGRFTREHETVLARHIRCALTVDELASEEDFYVFDYGNAM